MSRIPLSLLALCLIPLTSFAADPGVLPLGADGKPLNLDFETGTLKDWSAEGDAFKGQPVKGDTVFARRKDNKSEHQGEYWIGGYEKLQDKPQGTLTSVPFKVSHPWASFLVGGGPHTLETCVELVNKETGEVFFRASGEERENMHRVAVDLKDLQGKEMFIRLIDKHSAHWGHINFDDFRFHQEKPAIAPRPKTAATSPADVYKYAGLKPEEAAKAMTVPPGFEVKLFAGEPDVQQPIAMCLDDRGRLWIAEAFSYPRRQPEGKGKDRILIFEDIDGDGKFDKRTVFMEGLNLVSGLEVGFGGVWIGAAPYLMFVPMKDDKPAGEPKILLDGWAYQDTHETLNTAAMASSPIRASASRACRTTSACPSTPASGATIPLDTSLRSLRMAPATLGGSISTSTVMPSSRPASSPTTGTSSPAAVTNGRPALISTPTPMPTSRPSPSIATTSAPIRTAATAVLTKPAAATPTAAP